MAASVSVVTGELFVLERSHAVTLKQSDLKKWMKCMCVCIYIYLVRTVLSVVISKGAGDEQ